MQTAIAEPLRETAAGREADAILRSCVHCGFCTAACPTYQITGDELDGPRGRIYLIKALLEGADSGRETQRHLDRCLGCRACETVCPSGVEYHRLLDIGREALDQRLTRPVAERWQRRLLRALVPRRRRLGPLLRVGQYLRPLLPRRLARKVPRRRPPPVAPGSRHDRLMVLLQSCGQAEADPHTNAAAARVLDRLGIRLVIAERAGCCGALSHHLDAREEAKTMARRNIDAWERWLKAGAEAVVVSASGCGTTVKEYGQLLADDPAYRERAKAIASRTRDLSEVVAEQAAGCIRGRDGRRVAFHAPCSLQHAQGLGGVVERLLEAAGFELAPVSEPHLCCGSAGPYSLLQPELSGALLTRKVAALSGARPELIATANIGCQLHLQSGTELPVRHWIELLDEAME